jgi:hypothetical protein
MSDFEMEDYEVVDDSRLHLKDKDGFVVNIHTDERISKEDVFKTEIPLDADFYYKDRLVMIQDGAIFELNLHARYGYKEYEFDDDTDSIKQTCGDVKDLNKVKTCYLANQDKIEAAVDVSKKKQIEKMMKVAPIPQGKKREITNKILERYGLKK